MGVEPGGLPFSREAWWRARLSRDEAEIQARFDAAAAAAASRLDSSDPMVPELAARIAAEMPGELLYLSRTIVHPKAVLFPDTRWMMRRKHLSHCALTDFDLETGRAVIQVKGTRCNKHQQLLEQLRLSSAVTDKAVVGYAPYWKARNQGRPIERRITDLGYSLCFSVEDVIAQLRSLPLCPAAALAGQRHHPSGHGLN